MISVLDERGGLVPEGPYRSYGDAALKFEAQPPFQLVASTFEPQLFGPQPELCSLSYSEGAQRLPSPRKRFVSGLVVEPGQAVRFEEGEVNASFELFSGCQPELRCPEVESMERYMSALPAAEDFKHVAALDERTALVISTGDDGRLRLFEDGQERVLTDLGEVKGQPTGIAVQNGRFVGLTGQGWLFELEADGRLASAAQFPVRGANLSVSSDGLRLGYGEFGVRELNESQTATTPVERFEFEMERLHAVSRSRMAALADLGIFRFDGSSWSLEREDNVFEFDSLKYIGGDAENMMVIGRRERVLLRNGGAWDALPPPFDLGLNLNDVVAMGGGRFVVGAEAGGAAIWAGEGWCPPIDLMSLAEVSSISVLPGGRVLFFALHGTNATGEPSSLVRVRLSERL